MQASKINLIEQAERLKEQAIGALVATLVVVGYVVYFIDDQIEPVKVYTWVAAVLAVNVYLAVWIVFIYRTGITLDNVRTYVITYQLEAVAHGFSWGYLPFMLAQSHDINTQLFSYYVICSMAAGAIATTAMIYRIYISYMLPMMLPIVIDQVFFTEAQIFAGSTVGLLVIYIVAMLMLSYRHYESVLKSIVFSRRNDELVKDLRQEYERAEEASQAKSRFLANMSHELRTPLNAVIGYSEIIEEEASESGAERIAADAEKIRVSGKHLLSLIDDVLNLSRLDAGKVIVSCNALDVRRMVDELKPVMEDFLQHNNNKLEIYISNDINVITSDHHLLEKIILNLISNSAKFTQNGQVRLRVISELRNDINNVCFIIEDTGIGMDKKQQEILFDAFRQADESSTRKYGGMGLGMAVSQKFVQLLGGTIEVESEPGNGSNISVCLPHIIPVEWKNAS